MNSTTTKMFVTKRCRVCGNKASGFNYNGLSCASCKVFFYRNEHRKEKFTCRNGDGNCPMKVKINARRCMKCRMMKCLEIGMTKDGLDSNANSQLESSQSSENLVNSNSNFDNSVENRNSRIEKILEVRIKKNIENIENQPIGTGFDGKLAQLKNLKRSTGLKLSKLEAEQINSEIQKARSIFVEESNIKVIKQAQTYFDFCLPYQLYMGRIAKFCQQIGAYNQVNSDDQYRLFKSCCFSFLTIRTAYFYDSKHDGFVITEDDEGSSGIFRKFDFGRDESLPNVLMFNKNCTISLQAEMENDSSIRDLLALQQLFKPYASTSNPEFIRYHFMFYSRLLQRYLEHKYANCRLAAAKYSQLMSLVNHFPLMRDNKAALLTLYDNHQIPHIFSEIFNLV